MLLKTGGSIYQTGKRTLPLLRLASSLGCWSLRLETLTKENKMRRETLIDGVTAGVTTDEFNVYHRQPASISARGLAGVETCTLQMLTNGIYADVYDEDVVVQLTATQTVIFVKIPGTYKLVLTATAGATSVDKVTSGV
jgi:hypothetical protein